MSCPFISVIQNRLCKSGRTSISSEQRFLGPPTHLYLAWAWNGCAGAGYMMSRLHTKFPMNCCHHRLSRASQSARRIPKWKFTKSILKIYPVESSEKSCGYYVFLSKYSFVWRLVWSVQSTKSKASCTHQSTICVIFYLKVACVRTWVILYSFDIYHLPEWEKGVCY